MISGRMADRLDLDETQRETVKNIMEAAQPEMKALREKLRANHDALQALDVGDPEVQNIAASNGELATEATLLFSRIRGEIHAVLTDEQRAQLPTEKKRMETQGTRRASARPALMCRPAATVLPLPCVAGLFFPPQFVLAAKSTHNSKPSKIFLLLKCCLYLR